MAISYWRSFTGFLSGVRRRSNSKEFYPGLLHLKQSRVKAAQTAALTRE
jgi:hypothetical protein